MKKLVISTIAGAAAAAIWLHMPEANAEPANPTVQCMYEDGSDVIPDRADQCIWIDPDTGDMYINPTPEEVG